MFDLSNILGTMFPAANHAFQHIDQFYFTLFRYGFVTVILIPSLSWKEVSAAFRFEGTGRLSLFFGTMSITDDHLLIFWDPTYSAIRVQWYLPLCNLPCR